MGRFSENLKRRLGIVPSSSKEMHDPLHAMLDRSPDPMLTSVIFRNDSECALIFKSTLEENSDLVEVKEWKEKRLEVGKEECFPHCYFVIHSEDGRPCRYTWKAAPRGSDFIYCRRNTLSPGHS